MLKFLDGTKATVEIRRLIGSSHNPRLAVAFWGTGATQGLGLKTGGASVQVICNLASGGTNPNEIEELIHAGVAVRQCDTLHGKLYMFDNMVIIGSSNASANGLSFEGTELAGWQEANLLSDDSEVHKKAAEWLDALPSREITKENLEAARDIFSRRRHAAIGRRTEVSLIKALREHPETFANKRYHLCAYNELLDAEQDEKVADEQANLDDPDIGGFGWILPTQADLICFYIGPRGGVKFDDFWHRPEYEWQNLGEHPVWFAKKRTEFCGYTSNAIGPIAEWKDAVNRLHNDVLRYDGPWNIDLGSFGKKYLRA